MQDFGLGAGMPRITWSSGDPTPFGYLEEDFGECGFKDEFKRFDIFFRSCRSSISLIVLLIVSVLSQLENLENGGPRIAWARQGFNRCEA